MKYSYEPILDPRLPLFYFEGSGEECQQCNASLAKSVSR